jgi:hypothetical protein
MRRRHKKPSAHGARVSVPSRYKSYSVSSCTITSFGRVIAAIRLIRRLCSATELHWLATFRRCRCSWTSAFRLEPASRPPSGGEDEPSLPSRISIAHRARLAFKRCPWLSMRTGIGTISLPSRGPAGGPGEDTSSVAAVPPQVVADGLAWVARRGSPGVDHPGSLPGATRLGRS